MSVPRQKGAVGFVGLGNMGDPMARRIAQAGHRLRLYDSRPAALAALDELGERATAADSPAALGADCAVVITMLPDSEVVREVALGPGGLAEGQKQGALVIDMSSSAPTATQALGQALEERGIGLIDAPVSGGVPRARDGSLTIMAGGTPERIESVEPLLSCMGRVQRTGPLGSGHAMKALNNYVSAAGLLAVCEALIVAERFGLDPRTLNEVLKASTGRNNTTDRKVEPFILSRSFDSGFALALLRKDVGLARSLAADLDLEAPWLTGCEALLEEAAVALGPDADHTEAFAFLERRLGDG